MENHPNTLFQCLVLERAEEALKDNSILYCFKRDHQFITVLFHLQMLMRLEVSSVPTLSKISKNKMLNKLLIVDKHQ